MLSYAVDPGVLEPLVPSGTTLDTWHGVPLASVVGFRFLRTRVLGVPVPFHRDFEEVNLRFYVRRAVAGETRRGVVFVAELVPRVAITLVARLVYNEPYRTVPMRSTAPDTPVVTPGRLSYEWRIGPGWHRLAATPVGAPSVPAEDDIAAFVTEHYWGYTRQRDGATIEYAVEHPRWQVWTAESPALVTDVARLWGPAFVPWLARPPVSALVAEGSPVTVHRPRSVVRDDDADRRPRAIGAPAG